MLPVTVVLMAFGSSSVQELLRIGSKGRWVALILLAAIAVGRLAARGAGIRSLPAAWALAAALVLLGADSALWSVDSWLTIRRIFTLAVLFLTAGALAAAGPDARATASFVLRAVLAGVAAVAIVSAAVLLVSHHDAVLPATAGAGWRFRGVGENPNTVPMLLAVGMPIAVWQSFDRAPRARLLGVALVLLFSAEIALSGSRGGLVAAFGGSVVAAVALGGSLRTKLVAAAGLVALGFVCAEVATLPRPVKAAADAAPSSQSPVARTRGVDAQQVFRLEDEIGFPQAGAYRPPVPRTIFGSSGRAQAWNGALHQGARRPIAGYGFGTENRTFVDRFYSFEGIFVENTYLGLFLQLGTVGVAVFVALLVALGVGGARLLRRLPPAERGPAAAALGGLVAAILIGVVQSGLLAVGNIAAASVWICVLPLAALAARPSPA
jgi:hypothetical protein